MTFNIRDPDAVRKILEASKPANFNYKENYYLHGYQNTILINDSIRTLTILSISAHEHNLFEELFKGWKIADKSPLSFFLTGKAIVTFGTDWFVSAYTDNNNDVFIPVSKLNAFELLKKYLT